MIVLFNPLSTTPGKQPLPLSLMIAWLLKIDQERPTATVPQLPRIVISAMRASMEFPANFALFDWMVGAN